MKKLILATIAVGMAAVSLPVSSLSSASRAVQEGGPASPRELLSTLVSTELDAGERYRVVALSGSLQYVLFASTEDRSALLEGVSREAVPELATSVPVWISDVLLAEAFAGVSPGGGPVGQLREALVEGGLALPLREDRPSAVLTAVASSTAGDLFDFSMSEQQEGIIARDEGLDRLEGRSVGESASLKFSGAGHPSVELFEPWRFDDLPDALEDKTEQAERAARLAEVRRARLELELVRSLFHVERSYEPAIIDWLESLDQQEINLLAQILQISGFRAIEPQTLVQDGAPLFYESSVLLARIYQGLERVIGQRGRKKMHRLDPDQFASAETLQQAEAFYEGFFVNDGKGGFEVRLREPIAERIDRWSAAVRRISEPFVQRQLAGLAGGE